MSKEIRLEEEGFAFLKADEFMKKYPPNENLEDDDLNFAQLLQLNHHKKDNLECTCKKCQERKKFKNNNDSDNRKYRQD